MKVLRWSWIVRVVCVPVESCLSLSKLYFIIKLLQQNIHRQLNLFDQAKQNVSVLNGVLYISEYEGLAMVVNCACCVCASGIV